MRVIGLITAKDLRQRFRDRSALLFMFAVPLGLTIVFNLIFGELSSGGVGTIEIGVVTNDDELGEAFVESVLPGAGDELELEVRRFENRDAARRSVDAGDVAAAIVFPEGFSDAVQAGQAGDLLVLKNADAGLRADVAIAIADGFANRLTGTQVAVAAALRAGAPPEDTGQIANLASQTIAPLELTSAATANEQLDWSTHLAAGMAVFFLFFTVQFGVTSYLEERSDGTLPRLLAAPIHRWQVLSAKALTSFVVGIVATTVLIVAAIPLMGAEWGNPLGVGLLILAAVTAATALVGVVAALARTAEQANVWQSILAIVLGMLGGAFFPVARGAGLLAQVSLLSPHAWFLRGLGTLSGGGAVAEIVPALGAMLGFAAVVGAIGLVLARRVRTV